MTLILAANSKETLVATYPVKVVSIEDNIFSIEAEPGLWARVDTKYNTEIYNTSNGEGYVELYDNVECASDFVQKPFFCDKWEGNVHSADTYKVYLPF